MHTQIIIFDNNVFIYEKNIVILSQVIEFAQYEHSNCQNTF